MWGSSVGPQVYGNYDNLVTKGAESQQFVFHGLIQRLGNRFRSPMLVGTNNAVRIASLEQIGGLRDSITEDLATSLAWHSKRNPATGRNWRSVYTPDVSRSARDQPISPTSSANSIGGAGGHSNA